VNLENTKEAVVKFEGMLSMDIRQKKIDKAEDSDFRRR